MEESKNLSEENKELPVENPTNVTEESQVEEVTSESIDETSNDEVSEQVVSEVEKTEEETIADPADDKSSESLDEESEAEDDLESVESEDEGQEELPDFVAIGTEELVEMANKLLKEKEISKLRPYLEGIKTVVSERFDNLYKENLQLFLEQGGNVIDFKFHNPLRESFRKTYQEYREKRRSYYNLLEKELNVNLHRKEALIEELKELLKKEESISESFKELKSIRDRWNETGPVPKASSDNIWKTWHFHLDNFYDYVKLNDELRDLDFKKNRTAKEGLCVEAESLSSVENVGEAMGKLQELHKRWKMIGPVEPDLREPLWERFSSATQIIHEKRDAFREELAKRDELRIAQKKEVVVKMENFSTEGLTKHNEWQEATKEMEALFDAFKKLGRINHPENDELWQKAKQAYRLFQHNKNEHYKEIKKEQKANLEAKEALVKRAQDLKDSDKWRDTSNELKKLQEEWKKIGITNRKEGDRVWAEFREACDHFFNRMKQDRNDFKKKQKEVAKTKNEVIEELKTLVDDKEKLTKKMLLDTAKKYRSLGRLGRDFQKVEDLFEETLQKGFDILKMDRQEAARAQFDQKLEALSSQGDARALDREQQFIRRQLDEAQKEVQQLENNIQFFRSGKGTNPLIKQVEQKIAKEKERVVALRAQLKALRQAKEKD